MVWLQGRFFPKSPSYWVIILLPTYHVPPPPTESPSRKWDPYWQQ